MPVLFRKMMSMTKLQNSAVAGSGFLKGLEITKPTFVVDEAICRRNIARMAARARQGGVRFRPHFKTHQSAAIGEWFREEGVTAITVSSVTMARYFADAGWKDITIAFPVNLREIREINRLAGEVRLGLLVENEVAMGYLVKHLTAAADIWIEIDTGYHRSGVDTVKSRIIDQLLDVLKQSDKMVFRGFLSHSGQTYAARSVEDICIRHAGVLLQTRSLKNHYLPEWPGVEVSLGDTPACSVCDQWEGVDEIRPGNFVFYDLMQFQLGVCRQEEIAVRVVCPVVSRQIMRNEAVIYGGAVHLSKELMIGANGKKWYGGVVLPDRGPSQVILPGQGQEPSPGTGQIAVPLHKLRQEKVKGKGDDDRSEEEGRWRISGETWVAGLSQEHGVVRGDFEEIKAMQPGDLLEIIPVHSCLAADLAGTYLTTSGRLLGKMGKTDQM